MRRMRTAFTVQMTYPGVPHIYYGDEIAMPGENDPGCRACMIWEPGPAQQELRSYVRALIRLRAEHPALLRGGCITLVAEARRRIFAYARHLDGKTLIVVVNAANRPTGFTIRSGMIAETTQWRDVLGTARFAVENGTLEVQLSAYGSIVLGHS